MKLYNHVASRLSPLDLEIIQAVPAGGNWQNVPIDVPSKRLAQIREMARQRGGVVRTTYYGRLRWDRPSYTISTYFNRPGNGCNIHPEQNRTLTVREAARLQSFPDSVRFGGTEGEQRKQVGNAVPVLLARAVGALFPPGIVVDLFSGIGGLSMGFKLAGHQIAVASDIDQRCLEVHASIHPACKHIVGNLESQETQDTIASTVSRADLVIGGPPCQGWSYAGWHKQSDPRNALVGTFMRTIGTLRPKAVIMENVEGLIWMAQGVALTTIKAEIAKYGYEVTHFVLNAADFGVPQRRRRVFIVGVDSGERLQPPKPLFSSSDLFLPPPVNVRDAIGGLPVLKAGEGEDELEWAYPEDNVPYRDWCLGRIDFDTMYSRSVKRHATQKGDLQKPG